MSREMTIAWVRRNCPAAKVQRDVVALLDRTLAQGFPCAIKVGRRLTASGSAFLVMCFIREMFAFELTARQAQNLGVTDTKLVGVIEHTPHDPNEAPTMPVNLTGIHIDNLERLKVSEPIQGRCHIEHETYGLGPCALRLIYTLTGCASVVQFFHPPMPFVPRGETAFGFGPIDSAAHVRGGKCPQTVAAFFRLCKPPTKDHPEGEPISNTVGMLVDFA